MVIFIAEQVLPVKRDRQTEILGLSGAVIELQSTYRILSMEGVTPGAIAETVRTVRREG